MFWFSRRIGRGEEGVVCACATDDDDDDDDDDDLGVTRACIESRGIHQHTAVRLVRDVRS